MNILVLEPYFGGSHRAFLDHLASKLPFDFTFLTMPARKWKWRMRLSAPYFGELMCDLPPHDRILCSSFVDVATLRGLAPKWVHDVPIYTYFHENQFAYPNQINDARDLHFGLTNLTTALASDRIAFNSHYNLRTFLTGIEEVQRCGLDMKLPGLKERLCAKAVVLHPGLDFDPIDSLAPHVGRDKPPVILWNHRWEHDKNPEMFFRALFNLDRRGVDFQLMVLGQSFRKNPPIFAEAQTRLAKRITHFGYISSADDYFRCLKKAAVVVSTASHEFYGMAVIEAVRAGCRPLLPKRLAYPELFPDEYFYEDENLVAQLALSLQRGPLKEDEAKRLTEKKSWNYLAAQYQEWLSNGKESFWG